MSSRSAPGLDPSAVRVRITPMRRRHLRAVLRIEGRSGHRGWSLGLFMAELSRGEDRVYLVAKVHGMVVGFAGMLFAADEAHVTTVSVDPAWRERRVGTRLMLVLAERAVERGAQAMTLEVRASNEAAIALYRRFGFAPAGVRRNYYADLGEDALVMWAHEIASPEHGARLAELAASLPGSTVVEEMGR